MVPVVSEKYPRPQKRRPQYHFRISGNSRWTLWDEQPFILRTRSEMASFGGTDTNMCTWSLESTPCKISTPFSRQI